jgi:hypothetical protein
MIGQGDREALEVVASFSGDVTHKELAEELSISADAARSRVKRLRAAALIAPVGAVIPTFSDPPAIEQDGQHMTWRALFRLVTYVMARHCRGRLTTVDDIADHFDWSPMYARKSVTVCRKNGLFTPGWSLVITPRGRDLVAELNRRT